MEAVLPAKLASTLVVVPFLVLPPPPLAAHVPGTFPAAPLCFGVPTQLSVPTQKLAPKLSMQEVSKELKGYIKRWRQADRQSCRQTWWAGGFVLVLQIKNTSKGRTWGFRGRCGNPQVTPQTPEGSDLNEASVLAASAPHLQGLSGDTATYPQRFA